MRLFLLPPLCLAVVLASGCASPRTVARQAPTGSGGATNQSPIVTLDTMLSGKVAAYNPEGRFAVLSFPVGAMPKPNQTLFLYRNGLKVAELLVTGPQTDNNTVADLIKGDAQTGDEVRDR